MQRTQASPLRKQLKFCSPTSIWMVSCVAIYRVYKTTLPFPVCWRSCVTKRIFGSTSMVAMKHGPPPCHPIVMTRHDKTKASSHKASTVAILFVRSILNALMTMFSVAKDSEATMGPQGLSEGRILTADLLFLMVATFRAIITLNSNSLKQPSKDSFLMGVSNSRSPAAEKTQTRPLGTTRIVSNQMLRIAIPFSHTMKISKINVVLSPELISMLRKTKKISTRMSKPSMRHMRMPTIRMPTGQNPRMSETRNQKIPTPSMIKILVTVTLLRLLLPRSSNVASVIRPSNQMILYIDTFALDSISKSQVLTNPPFLAW